MLRPDSKDSDLASSLSARHSTDGDQHHEQQEAGDAAAHRVGGLVRAAAARICVGKKKQPHAFASQMS